MKKPLAMALLLSSASVYADLQQAILAFEQGEDKQAQSLFEAASEQAEAKIYLSRIWLAQDADKAEDWIEQAVAQAPQSAEAHFTRGVVMGQQAGNSVFSALSYAKKSLQSFHRAVELAPDNSEYRQGLMSFYLQAPGIAGGDTELALAQIKELESRDQRAGMLARLNYLSAGDNQQDYQQLLESAKHSMPGIPDFYFQAAMQLVQDEKYDLAIAEFKQAISQPASDQESLNSRYMAMYQLGRASVKGEVHIDEGIQALQNFIEHAPKNRKLPSRQWAAFRLANLQQLKGLKEQAKQGYLALQSSHDKKLAKEVKKKLKSL